VCACVRVGVCVCTHDRYLKYCSFFNKQYQLKTNNDGVISRVRVLPFRRGDNNNGDKINSRNNNNNNGKKTNDLSNREPRRRSNAVRAPRQ